MNVLIYKSKAEGFINAPPSKSVSHRLIIGAALSKKPSHIKNVLLSEDIMATIDCLKVLGAEITLDGSDLFIKGGNLIENSGGTLNLRESGSTLRFLLPLCLFSGKEYRMNGSKRLLERPLSVYEEIAESQGIYLKKDESITVKGRLMPGEFYVKGNISSQFISGLLFSLPLLEGDSIIHITPPIESKSYIDLTADILKKFGIKSSFKGNDIFISGNQTYSPVDLSVEGDYSSAAFLDAFNLLGGRVSVKGLSENSLQSDRVYKELFSKLKTENSPVIDLSDCPDLAPILMTLASYLNGACFKNTARLKLKESDRGLVMAEELSKFGADISVGDNTVTVKKSPLHSPVLPLCSHNDHRVVMSLAVLLTVFGGEIENAEAVSKSFPEFFKALKKLGIEFKTIYYKGK